MSEVRSMNVKENQTGAIGRYKVIGGKLVVAQLDVLDGVLRNVSINGDFFLDPDEALDAINAALDGLPATTAADRLTATVSAALPPGTEMFGFDAAAVAIAVRRAVGLATTWDDFTFDVIEPTPLSTEEHVAMDELYAREVGLGLRPPTLRFWEWESSSIVIGTFQSMQNEVDEEATARYGVNVVRRISGGGAMFMEPGNAITYSIYVPQSLVDGMSTLESYPFLDSWVMTTLARLGIRASYVPLNDIATDEGKIAGAAQKRMSEGGLLQHVSMSYDIDAEKMTQVLRITKEKLSGKGVSSAKKRVDPLRRQTGLRREDIVAEMLATFRDLYRTRTVQITHEDLSKARALVAQKFGTAEWTYRVP